MKIAVIRRILESVLVFCIILEFYTPYMVFPTIKHVIQILPILIVFCLILISGYSISKRFNIQILTYWLGALIPMLVINTHNYSSYIIRFVIFLPLIWIYLNLRKEKGIENYLSLFYRYSNIVIILSIVSLIMWILCSILQIIPPTMLIPFEWAPGTDFITTYWGIYFETQRVLLFGEWVWRNSGMFNEGPMYNMVLCIAFAIEFFMRPCKSKLKLFILTLTIITTFTTTGQFFLIGIIGWTFLRKVGYKYRTILIIIFPFFLYIGYLIGCGIMDNKKETGGEKSMNLRSEDITYCLEAGMEHPILGLGIVQGEGEGLWRGKQIGRSNSIFAIFARGGVYVLTLYMGVLLLIPYLYYKKNKDTKWLFTMLCFFFIFTITSSYLKYLTFLFMAWGLSNINLKRWKS